jgi:hypothetical protein
MLSKVHRNGKVLTLCFAVSLVACREKVTLGGWELPGKAGGSGAAGAGMGEGGIAELPACLQAGNRGPLNPAGDLLGATETATDWTWPSPVTSMQWDLMVEREIERDPPGAPPMSGYYWAYQFSLLEGAAGFLGIQAEGVYQTDPPESELQITKMAVFWLAGPPLDAELGDIAYPDARVAPTTAAGVSYLTIHARFDWQACRVYRFRLGLHSTESDGSVWYGAWIEDTVTRVDTFLGRMLLPADSGTFSPFSISRTMPIEFVEPASCDVLARGSALFGTPSTIDGAAHAGVAAHRFRQPLACASSRFTEFEGAVRHELGVR